MFGKEKTEKENRWNRIQAKVNKITDRRGMPIDEEMKETVTALQIFNFQTTASCKGHLTRGIQAPWVDIGEEIPKEILREVKKKAKENCLEVLHSIPEIKAFRKKHLREQMRLMILLDEFYKDRVVTIDIHLTLKKIGIYGYARLVNTGEHLQEIRSKKERTEKLREYQQEMYAFTDFLKRKYFETK